MEANVNTTDLEVPQTMQLDMTPTPEPIKPDDEAKEPPLFKDEVRQAIFAKRRSILTDEMASQGLTPQGQEEPEPVAVPEEPKPEEPVIEPEAPKAEPVIEAKTPEQEKFILQVYGQTKELTKDEIIREAQKGLAASQIFHEGHRMRDEALQIANAVKQNLQPQAVKDNPPQATQSVIDKDKAKEIAKRINYGSEEDQISAIIDLGASIEAKVRGQSQSLPPEQLVNIATQNAIAYIDTRTEQDTLKTEFSDILADQALSSAADVIANQLAQKYQAEGVSKSRLELFREAGKVTRERYLKPVEVAPPANPAPPVMVVDNTAKVERKRAAPKPPATASKVAVEPQPEYGVGLSSIVNQMRKARGQPVIT